ncbi:MAG: hypothetical protein ABFS43_07395 [Thermodesulfobacteriota bacterium]
MGSRYKFDEEAKMTNNDLKGELAMYSPFKAEELNKLLPKKIDKQRFGKLLTIVNSSASQQKKLANLKDNIEDLGGVVIKLLVKYLV